MESWQIAFVRQRNITIAIRVERTDRAVLCLPQRGREAKPIRR